MFNKWTIGRDRGDEKTGNNALARGWDKQRHKTHHSNAYLSSESNNRPWKIEKEYPRFKQVCFCNSRMSFLQLEISERSNL